MEFIKADHRVYKEKDGVIVAEITFPLEKEGVVNFNHTYVHSSLRGQGIAEKLILEAIDIVRANNYKAIATCSYAVSWFKKNPDVAQEILIKV